jgi:radical SAM superfamily enzyme YgiQ (UPF0313 family)
MSRLLFTHSYFLRFDPKQWKAQQPYPPLGTLYAAAVAREAGHIVSLFDPQFESSPEAIFPVLENGRPDALVVWDDGFNYLTKMCLTNMREAALVMIRAARDRGIVVLAASSDATDHPGLYLNAGARYVITGEGEQTLQELLATGIPADPNGIRGLAFLRDGLLERTSPRDVLRELDRLPQPAWDLVDMQEYRKRWQRAGGRFSLNISTTRGCPFKCNWCAKPIYGNRYNVHSPERVVGDLLYLAKHHRPDHLWITDDIFGLKPGWVPEFADRMESAGLRIPFKIQSRVDLLLQEQSVSALARAGCEEVWVGAESGSQRILDAMDKGTTVEQIRAATELLKRHGIRPAFFLQFGYPGETLDDIRATLRMVDELHPFDIGISVSYPLPGTVFHERVRSELQAKQNWTDSDELAVLFRSTYSGSFYKELQRFVHRRFRARQALDVLRDLGSGKALTAGSLRRIVSFPVHYSRSILHRMRLDAQLKEDLLA